MEISNGLFEYKVVNIFFYMKLSNANEYIWSQALTSKWNFEKTTFA